MRIRLREGLPYVSVSVVFGARRLELLDVLLDTGSRGTVFSTDRLLAIGLQYGAGLEIRTPPDR